MLYHIPLLFLLLPTFSFPHFLCVPLLTVFIILHIPYYVNTYSVLF
nr:MAG TPA: hypothetical protein [Bacteriophage sp.]DAX25368.1 MAG TPA: hypothetical protein [Caudoviricetes sp.]